MDITESLTVELDADGYALLYKVKLLNICWLKQNN